MNKQDVVKKILAGRKAVPGQMGQAFASTNIALCKYWGKRDEELNLPVTSSLSISLGDLGTLTELSIGKNSDRILFNGKAVEESSPFARRMQSFLNLFRPKADFFFKVRTQNSIPTAAGLASSASGFAALVWALNELFAWDLTPKELSILARLGSGSACRSIHSGFVEWQAGKLADGMDSYAVPLQESWPDLRIGIVTVSGEEKQISSRAAMQRTVETSPLYQSWPEKATGDLEQIKTAIREKDFDLLGRTAESNALAMHATMMAAWPPVLYWRPESIVVMQEIWRLRLEGVPIYFTMDAGPNVKILFLSKDSQLVKRNFSGVKIVAPFGEEHEQENEQEYD